MIANILHPTSAAGKRNIFNFLYNDVKYQVELYTEENAEGNRWFANTLNDESFYSEEGVKISNYGTKIKIMNAIELAAKKGTLIIK